jgi:hypothetical protein
MKLPHYCYIIREEIWTLVQTADHFDTHLAYEHALLRGDAAIAVGDGKDNYLMQCSDCTQWAWSTQDSCGFCGKRLFDLFNFE